MEVLVKPTEKPETLKQNLEKRVEKIKIQQEKLVIELEDIEIIEKTPGIEEYEINGEIFEGLKGRPVQEEAYIRIENKEDAVKALLATIDGYDLRILNTGRKWDLRQLKKYNPDIKHLKFNEPREILHINKAIGLDWKQTVPIELEKEDIEFVYREMLT